MEPALKIRPIKSGELPLLKDIAPPEWNSAITKLFTLFFGQPYFHPVVAEFSGEIAGCAIGLLNGMTGWLGNIIVRSAFRNRGIGSALTTHLVEHFQPHRPPHVAGSSIGLDSSRCFQSRRRILRVASEMRSGLLPQHFFQPFLYPRPFAVDNTVMDRIAYHAIRQYIVVA
jgi:hypothetical protein